MNIAVLGLGNVGLVTAIGLAKQGHKVIGVEVIPEKVSVLKAGQLYIHEKNLEETFLSYRDNLKFTQDIYDTRNVDSWIVCVGTPPRISGEVIIDQVVDTIRDIGDMFSKDKTNKVILRSTIPPGTIRKFILPVLNATEKKYSLIYHPEFLREGSALEDFLYPNLHVLGCLHPEAEMPVNEMFIEAEKVKIVNYETAEMLKYLNNSFHALKVSFINEIAVLASSFQVDVDDLIDSFLADTKLNISAKYFRPGFSFGGPCLNKELSALNFLAKKASISTPVISSILLSNEFHLRRSLNLIEKINPDSILFFGVCFKEGTDDIRSSPIIDLINLLQKGPSYLKKRKLYVREKDVVLNKKELYLCEKILELDDKVKDVDLVVLGPLDLTDLDRKWLEKYSGTILDLGYGHDLPKNMSEKIYKTYGGV